MADQVKKPRLIWAEKREGNWGPYVSMSLCLENIGDVKMHKGKLLVHVDPEHVNEGTDGKHYINSATKWEYLDVDPKSNKYAPKKKPIETVEDETLEDDLPF